jgi:hypothetical protein
VFENLGKWTLSIEHLLRAEDIHADDALTPSEGHQAVIDETIATDK